jgi:predicted amidohydrolase YtcJ
VVTPDLIVLNARIRTMDPARPSATALAIAGERIVALGDETTIAALAGPETRRIDAGGRLVLPGFQDPHVHLLSGGTDLATAAQIYEAAGIEELQSILAAHARRMPQLGLVIGSGWQPGLFGDHNLTRHVLDAVVSDRPVILYDSSYHNACLNSAALAIAGIVKGTPDPVNGHFVTDPSGEPTGMLHEDAIAWALQRLPALTDADHQAGLRAGQAHANQHGITGIIDPRVTELEERIYRTAAEAGALTLRVSGAALVREEDTPETALARLTAMRRANPGPDFWVQSAKFFMDGVFENRTAALLAPYADAPGGNCPTMFTPEQTRALMTALDAARFQIHVHVIGDAAARTTIEGLEAALAVNGRWPALHQLTHLQLLDPADFARIAQLGAMANIQTLWARYDPTMNPFEIIETAVTRQAPKVDGPREVFQPQERLTVEEAVLGYTSQAAAACWRGDFTGRLLPGFSADLIVLDRDIFACPPDEISDTKVLLTLFKGRPVWQQEGWDA